MEYTKTHLTRPLAHASYFRLVGEARGAPSRRSAAAAPARRRFGARFRRPCGRSPPRATRSSRRAPRSETPARRLWTSRPFQRTVRFSPATPRGATSSTPRGTIASGTARRPRPIRRRRAGSRREGGPRNPAEIERRAQVAPHSSEGARFGICVEINQCGDERTRDLITT